MKKVTMFLLLVIVASTMLMAAAPLRLVRLNIINKSGNVIYMQLKGQVSDQFYYLTVAEGDRVNPEDVTFTIVQDVYSRTTWYGPGDAACEGLSTKGQLWAIKNIKLNFTPCGRANIYSRTVLKWDPVLQAWVWYTPFKTLYGEPSWGEKVSYFKWIEAYTLYGWGTCLGVVKKRSYKSPRKGCLWVYKY